MLLWKGLVDVHHRVLEFGTAHEADPLVIRNMVQIGVFGCLLDEDWLQLLVNMMPSECLFLADFAVKNGCLFYFLGLNHEAVVFHHVVFEEARANH